MPALPRRGEKALTFGALGLALILKAAQEGGAMIQSQKRPTPNEFIDFSLCGSNLQGHLVYRWLLAQPSYGEALRRLKHKGQDLDFAQRVSGCFGRFFAGRKISEASTKKLAAAAKDYGAALKWCQSGFGPYAEDDRDRLEKLLAGVRDYMLGKHVASGFQLKSGVHRSVGILVRELVVYLDIFDIPSRALNSTIVDLVSIVANVDTRTVERHVKNYRRQLKATDQ